ncbi:IS30 family transposase [Glutamicibacter sp. AOP33-2CA-4]|uniref:IS30 family transposase n=1 Tax=Glutamicibacter sp. AOP33-2CA-4 TaxID=3457690 RepID=UPI004034DABF
MSPRNAGKKREEFLKLRAEGKGRSEATEIVGVHPKTGAEWDNGIRKIGGGRIYPDGRLVDYKRGMTTTVTASGVVTSKPAPGMAALEKSISPRYLSLQERERIYALHQSGETIRSIAQSTGRSPATISRELRRNNTPLGYQPYSAHRQSATRRPRPKPSKLAAECELRKYVVEKLEVGWSPEQISHRMIADHPDNTEMRVCHETIYQAIYLQPRGGLKREVEKCLRTGRARRKQHRSAESRTPRFRDPMINISERPASVEDRAVPGDWEGDLILGAGNKTAIATLVERSTRFVMLVHLPVDHTAQSVRDGLIQTMGGLPKLLRGSLTWDQGVEMAEHLAFGTATDMDVYFCDPHSPWQHGTNENTNGLLRQYFPKGTDLSVYGPKDLEHVCNLLNGRPRKTLGWKTPAERLGELLSVA